MDVAAGAGLTSPSVYGGLDRKRFIIETNGAGVALLLVGFSPFQAEEEHVRAGNERLRAGDAAGARRAYDEAERSVGAHPEIDFDRGNAALREGRLEDARAAWERAAAGAPAPLASRALQNLGTALAGAGDREGALRALSDALAKDPSNEDARWNLEVLLRKTGERPPPPRPQAGASSGPSTPEREAGKSGERERGREAERPEPERAGAERRDAGKPREAEPAAGDASSAGRAAARSARDEPLSRREAEALLDALQARERHMPFFGGDGAKKRSDDAAKDW